MEMTRDRRQTGPKLVKRRERQRTHRRRGSYLLSAAAAAAAAAAGPPEWAGVGTAGPPGRRQRGKWLPGVGGGERRQQVSTGEATKKLASHFFSFRFTA